MGTSNVTKRIAKHMRQYALGAAVAAALALPTTALGWDYAQVPLFWDTGVHPNVAFMIDDSRSMQYLSTNEAFSRWKGGTDPVALTSDTFYFCNNYNYTSPSTSSACNSTVYTVNEFTVQTPVYPAPASASVAVNVTTSGGYSSDCNTSSRTNGVYKAGNNICKNGHGISPNARLVYTVTSGTTIGGLANGQVVYAVQVDSDSFKVATAPGGTPITFGTITTGNYSFSGLRVGTVPKYIYQDAYFSETFSATSVSAALCDVTKAPGSPGYYIGTSNSSNFWLSSNVGPASKNVGVLVSNKSGGGGTKDSCVRWKEGNTAQQPTTAGTVCNSLASCATYPDSRDVYTPYEGGYGAYLARRLVTVKSTYNFADSLTYPNSDPDLNVFNSTLGVGSDYRVIPNLKRIEAAREAAQQIVLDNYTRMQIGLFSFTPSDNGERNVSCGNGTNPSAEKAALIGAMEGMGVADLPLSAGDGAIGLLKPETATPLAKTQAVINSYFSGGSSPIQYRCQKNYAVVMTDGDPTNDSGTLDGNAQTGYDVDAKTTGNDIGGKSYNTTEFGGIWAKQRVVTFTVGFGLENNLLKRTPLVDQVNITKSEIIGNKFKSLSHGLSTGDYVQVVSGAATGLTNGNYYYAVKVDGDTFKLASCSSTGDTGTGSTNCKQKAFDCASTGTTSASGPCLPVTGGSGTMVMSIGPGKALFSFTPQALSQSLGDVFNKINALVASASAVSTNSKQLGADTLVYQARFNTEDWSGEVAAYAVNPSTGKVNTAAAPAWTTKTKLDTVAERGTLLTWNVDSNAGAPFGTLADLGATQAAKLNGDINALNWLKGNDIATPAGFRSHSINGLMGDIINADPVFVGALNFGYQTLPASDLGSCAISGLTATGTGCTGAEIYAAYLANRKATATPMLFAGTNGGAMHVLNSTSGSEIMAYYPAGVFEGWDDINNNGVQDAGETEKKLYNLTQSTYDHRFFVDGAGTTSDAFIGSSWKAFFVGGLGAGGRSVYAIDASDASFGPSDIKWEFTNPNLGYSYGKPTIARFSNNKWYAVFPNGTDSNGDKASVFVVSLTNASDYHELTVSNGDSAASPNGMMTVAVSQDNERTAEYIYAGDMKGNIWKFYVGGGGWPSGTKLFTAKDSGGLTQSITGGLRIGKHPASLGNLVYFGTGKYFENVDKDYKVSSVPQIDSFYAILDDGTTNMTRGSLQVQTFTTTGGLRTGSTNVVDYTTKQGWYIDLTVNGAKQGERVISTPVLSGSRLIFVSIVPSGGDKCISNGTSWLNELDALDGSMLDDKVLDTDNDGDIDASDTKVTSVQLDGMASEPSILDGGDGKSEKKIMGSTSASSSIITVTEKKGATESLGGSGRMSWQQIQ